MLVRIILVSLILLIIVMSLSDSGNENHGHPFNLDLSTESFFKNACMNEIIGLSSSPRAGLKYCDCVVKEFRAQLMSNVELFEAYSALVVEQRKKSKDPRALNEVLAFRPGMGFSVDHVFGDRLLEPAKLLYPFVPDESQVKIYTEGVDFHWKQAMIVCADNPLLHSHK